MSYSDELINLVKSYDLEPLLEEVKRKRDGIMSAALEPGETDFDKGQVAALNKVLRLPDDVLRSESDSDKKES